MVAGYMFKPHILQQTRNHTATRVVRILRCYIFRVPRNIRLYSETSGAPSRRSVCDPRIPRDREWLYEYPYWCWNHKEASSWPEPTGSWRLFDGTPRGMGYIFCASTNRKNTSTLDRAWRRQQCPGKTSARFASLFWGT